MKFTIKQEVTAAAVVFTFGILLILLVRWLSSIPASTAETTNTSDFFSEYAKADNVKYFKDSRTQYCFAYVILPDLRIHTLGNVSCANVEGLLE